MTEMTSKDNTKFAKHRGRVEDKVCLDRTGHRVRFRLTKDEWWDIWQKSGHYHERGCRKGQYVMSRYNDLGDYVVGNVFIQTHSDNVREHLRHCPISAASHKKSADAQRGRKMTPEQLERHRAAMTGAGNGFFGKHHTEETKTKIRLAKLKVSP